MSIITEDGTVDRKGREALRSLASAVDIRLNGLGAEQPNGFVLLVFPRDAKGPRVNYVSNCDRDSVVAALREILARFEGK